MDLEALNLFSEVVSASVPYAITWAVGKWLVNTLLDWMMGRSDRI